LVVAAFNLAAVVSDYKKVEHQNLDFFWLSPVPYGGLQGSLRFCHKDSCSKLQFNALKSAVVLSLMGSF
jgi:hypothetical protein